MAVVANAVADALGDDGRRLDRIPCKPEIVMDLLQRGRT